MTQTRELTGRVALVTGGGSGLGRATCLRLARGGATVIAGDVDETAAKETASLAGGSAGSLPLDVADASSVAETVDRLVARYGAAFDLLVNNAGTDRGADLVDITDEQWAQVVAVNQTGPMLMSRAFVRAVLADQHSQRDEPADVVNVISISAVTVGSGAAAYNASKAALAKLTEVVQREAYQFRWPIRVHGLMPSAMNTPMMEQWQLSDEVMMDPDTVASAIEFMVRLPADSFVQNLVINSRREPDWPR